MDENKESAIRVNEEFIEHLEPEIGIFIHVHNRNNDDNKIIQHVSTDYYYYLTYEQVEDSLFRLVSINRVNK